MIFYVTSAVRRGGTAPALPALRGLVTALAYGRVLEARRLLVGTYLFAGVERLAPDDAARAAALWDVLAAARPAVRLLNHPGRVLGSYSLVRRLHAEGAHAGDAVRLDEARAPARYPVVLRDALGGGWLSGRLDTPAALDAAREDLDRRGVSRRRVMAVEGAEPEGAARALVVGERVIALAGAGGATAAPPSGIRAVAALARLDYGSLEYGVRGGRLVVWGVDTDPALDAGSPAAADLAVALRTLDTSAGGRARRLAIGLPRRPGPAVLRGPRARLAERLKELSDRLPRW